MIILLLDTIRKKLTGLSIDNITDKLDSLNTILIIIIIILILILLYLIFSKGG